MTKSVNIFLRFYQCAEFVAKPKKTEQILLLEPPFAVC